MSLDFRTEGARGEIPIRGTQGQVWLKPGVLEVFTLPAALLLLSLSPPSLTASTDPPTAAPAYTLSVSRGTVTLASRGAMAKDVLADLSAKLKVPIRFSEKTGALRLSAKWENVPLDTALALLSPRVFVDVMFDDQNPEGRYEAIHLVAPEEPDPAKAADLAGVMIIHGNTANEDEGPAAAGAPSPEPADPTQPLLRVRVENDLISVKARGQTVAAILAQVAVLTRARLITRGTLDPEPAELDFAGAAAEALPCLIARPGVSVLVRRDLEKNVSQLLELRYGVVEP